ncbi:hypothetical protein BJ742DRAFT_870493 [Cladochytrium replicatum]|nr:hypothetical protein BJ742DRAFT_870493 [Cladochytrium replicatum]
MPQNDNTNPSSPTPTQQPPPAPPPQADTRAPERRWTFTTPPGSPPPSTLQLAIDLDPASETETAHSAATTVVVEPAAPPTNNNNDNNNHGTLLPSYSFAVQEARPLPKYHTAVETNDGLRRWVVLGTDGNRWCMRCILLVGGIIVTIAVVTR